MTRRLQLLALLLVLAAAPGSALGQESVPRAIALPDTLGANFGAGNTLTGSSQPSDYDFLIGTWGFRFQATPDRSFTLPFTGRWVFTRKRAGGQGVLIEDGRTLTVHPGGEAAAA